MFIFAGPETLVNRKPPTQASIHERGVGLRLIMEKGGDRPWSGILTLRTQRTSMVLPFAALLLE